MWCTASWRDAVCLGAGSGRREGRRRLVLAMALTLGCEDSGEKKLERGLTCAFRNWPPRGGRWTIRRSARCGGCWRRSLRIPRSPQGSQDARRASGAFGSGRPDALPRTQRDDSPQTAAKREHAHSGPAVGSGAAAGAGVDCPCVVPLPGRAGGRHPPAPMALQAAPLGRVGVGQGWPNDGLLQVAIAMRAFGGPEIRRVAVIGQVEILECTLFEPQLLLHSVEPAESGRASCISSILSGVASDPERGRGTSCPAAPETVLQADVIPGREATDDTAARYSASRQGCRNSVRCFEQRPPVARGMVSTVNRLPAPRSRCRKSVAWPPQPDQRPSQPRAGFGFELASPPRAGGSSLLGAGPGLGFALRLGFDRFGGFALGLAFAWLSLAFSSGLGFLGRLGLLRRPGGLDGAASGVSPRVQFQRGRLVSPEAPEKYGPRSKNSRPSPVGTGHLDLGDSGVTRVAGFRFRPARARPPGANREPPRKLPAPPGLDDAPGGLNSILTLDVAIPAVKRPPTMG